MSHFAEARVLPGQIADFVGQSELESSGHATLEARPRTFPVEVSAAGPLRLSAVVATYQGERFLREQLQSMLEQSVALSEIVIADDCSSDSTLAIADEMKARSSIPIEILR